MRIRSGRGDACRTIFLTHRQQLDDCSRVTLPFHLVSRPNERTGLKKSPGTTPQRSPSSGTTSKSAASKICTCPPYGSPLRRSDTWVNTRRESLTTPPRPKASERRRWSPTKWTRMAAPLAGPWPRNGISEIRSTERRRTASCVQKCRHCWSTAGPRFSPANCRGRPLTSTGLGAAHKTGGGCFSRDRPREKGGCCFFSVLRVYRRVIFTSLLRRLCACVAKARHGKFEIVSL